MKNNKLIYIILFALLYFAVGFVSTIHAISFFSLANTTGLAILLAIAFEIGQSAVLFDILTNPSDRKKIMPWALMCLLTFVQILGNVYSSYKYLISNSIDNLPFFKEPIFVWWTNLPDNVCNVILTYLIGATLPIVSLCLSEMLTTRLNDSEFNESKTKQDILQTENNLQEQITPEQTTKTAQKTDANSHFINLT